MEDAATAEICRSQLWQYRKYGLTLNNKAISDLDLNKIMNQELDKIRSQYASYQGGGKLSEAAIMFRNIVYDKDFIEFITLPAYMAIFNAENKGK